MTDALPTGDLLGPTALPAEVAVEDPPLAAFLLDMIEEGRIDPGQEHYAGEDLETLTSEAQSLALAEREVIPWEITDEGAAEWAGGHLVRHSDRVAALERQANEWHRRIDRWLEREARGPRSMVAFFTTKLEDWGRRQREASGGKVKSWGLPSVAISSRAGKDKFEVTDEDALVSWLEEHLTPDQQQATVKVTKKVLLTGLAAVKEAGEFTVDASGSVFDPETGEPVPGLSFRKGEVGYTVKPS